MQQTSNVFEDDYLTLERAFFGDTIYIRWREIRAISGTIGQDGQGQPEVVEGSCTLFLEGELGYAVNCSAGEVIEMIKSKQTRTIN